MRGLTLSIFAILASVGALVSAFDGTVDCLAIFYSEQNYNNVIPGETFGFATGPVAWKGDSLYFNIWDFGRIEDEVGFDVEKNAPRSLKYNCSFKDIPDAELNSAIDMVTLALYSTPLWKDNGGTRTNYTLGACRYNPVTKATLCESAYVYLEGQDRTASGAAFLFNFDFYLPGRGSRALMPVAQENLIMSDQKVFGRANNFNTGSLLDSLRLCAQTGEKYDWKTCNAVEILLPAYSEVYAVDDGIVLGGDDWECLRDNAVGMVIETTADRGCLVPSRKVLYKYVAGGDNDRWVNPGDRVTKGQVVAWVAFPGRGRTPKLRMAVDNSELTSETCPVPPKDLASPFEGAEKCEDTVCEFLSSCEFFTGEACELTGSCSQLTKCFP
eukprot:gene23458-17317_t